MLRLIIATSPCVTFQGQINAPFKPLNLERFIRRARFSTQRVLTLQLAQQCTFVLSLGDNIHQFVIPDNIFFFHFSYRDTNILHKKGVVFFETAFSVQTGRKNSSPPRCKKSWERIHIIILSIWSCLMFRDLQFYRWLILCLQSWRKAQNHIIVENQ